MAGAEPATLVRRLRLEHPWQLALLLPVDWTDERPVRALQDCRPGDRQVAAGRVVSGPTFRPGAPSRVTLTMELASGELLPVTAFGALRPWTEQLRQGGPARILGMTQRYGERIQLRGESILDPRAASRVRAIYPSVRRGPTAEEIAGCLNEHLEDYLAQAGPALRERFAWWGDLRSLRDALGVQGRIEDLIRTAHRPASVPEGRRAVAALERLGGIDAIRAAHAAHPPRLRQPLPIGPLDSRLACLPFELTPEQARAVEEIMADLRGAVATSRVILGDVGTGKSVVYQLAMAAVADAGGRAAVLVPNETLAHQVAAELQSWWPDLDVKTVTGSTKTKALETKRVLVGTTALLTRSPGDLDLIVVDEQQKFSVAQRAALAGSSAHRLEVTATCIPRTQALLTYGTLRQTQLTTGHAKKQIKTRIWEAADRSVLMDELQRWIAAGEQLLVVYARKAGDRQDPRSAYQSLARWERLAPGKVVVSTSDEGGDAKRAVADAMREGRAQILTATTTIEVGISLPRLRRVVIVDPDRFGLDALHQIRGRVARLGGAGWCDLVLGGDIQERTRNRLEVLLTHTDGFAIARENLALRGPGDLSAAGTTQSGVAASLLPVRAVSIETLDAALKVYRARCPCDSGSPAAL